MCTLIKFLILILLWKSIILKFFIFCFNEGFKPGQRKVLYTCFKRNDKREVKVAQLAGSVAEMSAYHHGEVGIEIKKYPFTLIILEE